MAYTMSNKGLVTMIKQKASLTTISNQHIDQLVDLVLTTDHFQCFSSMHKLNNDYAFAKTDFILPYIPHTTMVLDENNNVAGFYAALTKENDLQVVKDMDWNRDDPNVQLLFDAENLLLDYIADTDYFLYIFAVRPDLHGVVHRDHNKKISHWLFEELLQCGHAKNSKFLAIMAWESHAAAVKLYARYNGTIVQSVDLSNSVFSDKLLLFKIPIDGMS